jgi:integrase
MATIVLSNKTVSNLLPRQQTYVAYDSKLSGFGCRVTPTGSKSWIVEYRSYGGGRRAPKKRITLASVSTLPVTEARQAASRILARARLGEDVAGEKLTRRRAPTIRELADRFMSEEVRPTRKPSTAAIYDMYFRLHVLPALGGTRAIDLNRNDLSALHREIGRRAAVTANRVLTLLSELYSWAAKVGEVPQHFHPAKGITKYREEGRERYLSTEELGRLGDALREAETTGIPWVVDQKNPKAKHAAKLDHRYCKLSPWATAAIRLLLLTGCRLREILDLEWEHVDFERGMLFLADSKSGRKSVMLSDQAIDVLANTSRMGKFVIFSTDPNRPRADLKRPWNAIKKRAGLHGVRLHDLRHSFAATGAGRGLGLQMIGRLLGHRSLETTSRYAHLDAHPIRIAVNCIAGQISGAMDRRLSASSGTSSLTDLDLSKAGQGTEVEQISCTEASHDRELPDNLLVDPESSLN